MKRERWIVMFELEDVDDNTTVRSDPFTQKVEHLSYTLSSSDDGVLTVEEDGLCVWYMRTRNVLLPWTVVHLEEVGSLDNTRLRVGLAYCRRCQRRTPYYFLVGESNPGITCDRCGYAYDADVEDQKEQP